MLELKMLDDALGYMNTDWSFNCHDSHIVVYYEFLFLLRKTF